MRIGSYDAYELPGGNEGVILHSVRENPLWYDKLQNDIPHYRFSLADRDRPVTLLCGDVYKRQLYYM